MNNRSNQLNPNNKAYHSSRNNNHSNMNKRYNQLNLNNKLYNLSVFIGEFINKIDFEIELHNELDEIEVNEILEKEKQLKFEEQIKILEKEKQIKLEKEKQIKILEKERQIKLEKERQEQIKLEKKRQEQIKLEREKQSKLEERKRIAKIRENNFINNKVEEKEINNNKKKDDIPTCTICLDDINEPLNMYITECCHKYHLDCMTDFSKYNNNKCPVCNQRINLSSLKNKQKLQRRNINPAPERRGRSQTLERRGRSDVFCECRYGQGETERRCRSKERRCRSKERRRRGRSSSKVRSKSRS